MKAYHENREYLNNLNVTCSLIKNLNFYGHWHNDIELIFVKKGSINIGLNNEYKEIYEGSLVICSGNDIHYYNSKDKVNDIYVLIFKPDLIDSPGVWPPNENFLYKYITSEILLDLSCSHNLLEEIQNSIEVIYKELSTKINNYEYIVKSELFKICGLLLRHIPFDHNNERNNNYQYYNIDRIYKAITYIEDNYKNPLTLKEVSSICNTSSHHFSRLFNKIIGQTFPSYINQLRINKAEELLSNDSFTISYIAMECGFESIRTFNRVFKEITGVSPSEIRKNNIKKVH